MSVRVRDGERGDQTKVNSRVESLVCAPDMESQSLPKCFTYPVALEITLKKRFHEADWRREESSPTGAL
jgi:hypothetical protein